ncbi:TRM10 [Candida pseudojiufengensis]|uniref:TRM10 n=1 Tax=Candida pseudojiufengensis TaxID=497109 RepID=UPI0022244D57|nr:TRM10 [Candida pseudojiufengensis]KAI5960075.1 TRM10 [Candida pseudojiufengensis]
MNQQPQKVKNNPPSAEEIERRRKAKQNEVLPEGMSRREWKKIQKQQKWEETKDQYREVMRAKKKLQRDRKRDRIKNDDEYKNSILKKPKTQIATDVKFIIDCEFDDLMNIKEITSMSRQIQTSYSIMRHSPYKLPIQITSFNKRLQERFETSLQEYKNWQGIEFTSTNLEELITEENKDQFVYLTADTDDDLMELTSDHTYIIGGIVDKNRHKRLCYDKAKKLGLKCGRLPIGKYIKLYSRDVLVTSHVYEICCKWFEFKDWGDAFNKVLPPRKVASNGDVSESKESESKVGESKEHEIKENKIAP